MESRIVVFELGGFYQNAGNGTAENVTVTWPNGSIYYGSLVNFIAHGHGTLRHPHGDIYIGCWLQGKASGGGTYASNDGITFRGFWTEGGQNGMGVTVTR